MSRVTLRLTSHPVCEGSLAASRKGTLDCAHSGDEGGDSKRGGKEKGRDFDLHACGQAEDPGKARHCALMFYSSLSVGTFLQKGRKWGLGLVAHARNPSTKRLR